MRWYTYIDPAEDGGTDYHIVSEEWIRDIYFQHWKGKMDEKYGENYDDTNFENCLLDWQVVNWSEEFSMDRLWSFLERNKKDGTHVHINGKLLSSRYGE